MRTALATLLILLAFHAHDASVYAGKLSAVRDSVREDKPKSESKKKKSKKRSRRSSDCRDDSDSGWLSLSLGLLTPEPTPQVYREPVYQPSNTGTMVTTANAPTANASAASSASTAEGWFGRMTLFGGTDFETLDQGQFALLAQVPNAFGLDVSVNTFRESTPTIRDQLWLGDANVVIEPIFGDFRARLGAGFNWLHDSLGTEYGMNLTAGFDSNLSDLLMLTGEVDLGSLGESDLLHAQLTLGYQLGPAEMFAGYNYYDIGGAKLDGTVFGLRFRF